MLRADQFGNKVKDAIVQLQVVLASCEQEKEEVGTERGKTNRIIAVTVLLIYVRGPEQPLFQTSSLRSVLLATQVESMFEEGCGELKADLSRLLAEYRQSIRQKSIHMLMQHAAASGSADHSANQR